MTTPFRTSATIVLVTAVSIGALVVIMFTFRGG